MIGSQEIFVDLQAYLKQGDVEKAVGYHLKVSGRPETEFQKAQLVPLSPHTFQTTLRAIV